MASHKKGAKKQGKIIIFFDESGVSLTPHLLRTWAPIGETPIVRTVLGGKRIHLLGALAWWPQTQKTDQQFEVLIQAQTFGTNSISIAHFLDALKEQVGNKEQVNHKCILIWDNLPAHKSVQTKAALREHSAWLRVRYLPAYAPDLNPVEGLWSSLKCGRLAGYCPNTIAHLEDKVQSSITEIESDKTLMRGFFLGTPLFKEKDFKSKIESHVT